MGIVQGLGELKLASTADTDEEAVKDLDVVKILVVKYLLIYILIFMLIMLAIVLILIFIY